MNHLTLWIYTTQKHKNPPTRTHIHTHTPLSLEETNSLLCVVIHRALQESLITGYQQQQQQQQHSGDASSGDLVVPARPAGLDNGQVAAALDEVDSIPDYLDPNLELAIKLSQEEERRREEERKREEEMLAEVLRLSLEEK